MRLSCEVCCVQRCLAEHDSGRPWMAIERAVDRSASVCRMPCGVRVRTCSARTQFSPQSEHLDVPCLPGLFRGLLTLPQMASLPESGQGLRLYERNSSVCKCMFATYTVYVSRAGPFEHHVERACVSISGLSLAVSMSGCPPRRGVHVWGAYICAGDSRLTN